VAIPLLCVLDRNPAIPFVCYAQLLSWGWGVVFGKKNFIFCFFVIVWAKFPLNPFSISENDKNKRG
jgi:hypothetical protein